jgi:Fe-S-cluster containining protein
VDVCFNCTECGKCCRNTKIPLTVKEAVRWLEDGNSVQVLCEAWLWEEDRSNPDPDPELAYLRRRSFAGMSGTMPARLVATLVANIQAQCPNLMPDQRCGIYERRPLVCRIYPAEINPFRQVAPLMKACPPEAWATHLPLLTRNGAVMSEELRQDIARWHERLGPEVAIKRRVCAYLNIGAAAVAHEGFLVFSPPRAALLGALAAALRDEEPPQEAQWRLVTDRPETVERFTNYGAVAGAPRDLGPAAQYIGLARS